MATYFPLQGFILILGIIAFGATYLIFKTFYKIFRLKTNALFYFIVIASALLFVIGSALETLHTEITRELYVASAIWAGTLFIAFWIVLLVLLASIFVSIQNKTFGFVLIGIIILLSIYAVYHSSDTQIHETSLTTKKFNESLKIVELSDLHLGAVRSTSFVRKIVDLTNSANPDIVVIAGDLFDGTGIYDENILSPFNDIKVPTYFILGNHDIYTGTEVVLKYINSTQIHVIRNNKVDYRNIQIIGIDDSSDPLQAPDRLENISFDKNKYSILLYHRPDGFEQVSNEGIDLMLSGHTHAGQIFPFGILENLLLYKHLSGEYSYNNSNLIVLEGVGTWGPPMRLGTDSEIMLIKINS
ncbi:3',5'-cyclic adenosine monophosphate phosphodiesterase CpdA [uncultured archaeon]|nr:3',5'-cyclic adenosine monophosphate phosphodiesterase CpdA [uncultured archaeon]